MTKVRQDTFDPKIGLLRGASRSKELLWYLCKMIFFLTSFPYPSIFKIWLLRKFGAKVGYGVIIKPRVNIHFPWKLIIGDHVWIGEETFLLNFEILTIQDHCCISQRAFLCGGNHDYRIPSMPYRNGPISILNGAWIGASVFVGPNVIIGENVVVTAGSVITKSLETNGIYRGNPTEKIGERW